MLAGHLPSNLLQDLVEEAVLVLTARQIRDARGRKGIEQKQLANAIGVNPVTIWRYEHSEQNTDDRLLQFSLCEQLGLHSLGPNALEIKAYLAYLSLNPESRPDLDPHWLCNDRPAPETTGPDLWVLYMDVLAYHAYADALDRELNGQPPGSVEQAIRALAETQRILHACPVCGAAPQFADMDGVLEAVVRMHQTLTRRSKGKGHGH